MFLHPGIIALVLGSGVVLILVFFASALGIRILRRWDMSSSSEEQLELERKTYLVSTLVHYALLFEVLSVFLYVYTAEDIHPLLVGAMCATGSLNANAFGFPALYAKIASFFIAASWIAMNSLDNRAADYPLIRTKYKLLTAALLVLAIEFYLQLQYFMNIDPDVITSCCGVLFSEKGEGMASSLASSPARFTMVIFYSLLALVIVAGTASYRKQAKTFIYSFSLLSFAFLIVSVISVISFISLYFYQLPTHHCPFDMLQKEYYYAGYPLYASLFAGGFFGIMTGAIEFFKKIPSMREITINAQHRWSLYSVISFIIFAVIASAPIIFLPFKMN